MSPSFNQKTAYALVIAGFIFIASVVCLFASAYWLLEAKHWVDHTNQVIQRTKDCLIVLLNCETGQRGYVCTADKSFLEPLKKSELSVATSIAQVRQLVQDDSEETSRIVEIERLAKVKMDFVNQVLFVYQTSPAAASALIATGQGKRTMDAIRKLIAQTESHQLALLDKRKEEVARLQNLIIGIIVLLTLLEGGSLIYIYNLNRVYADVQRKSIDALQSEIAVRLKTEANLRETATNLTRSNEDLQQFAYVASHDLQEPLRAVQGFTSLLAKTYRDQLDERALGWIDQSTQGVERMRTLINGLLEYARVESRGGDMVSVNLGELLKDVQMVLADSIAQNDATIVCQELPTITGDENQLRQLFINLIGNALKYRSDKAPVIVLSSSRVGSQWQIQIADNGIGFDPQYAEKIFVIFQRLHSRSKYEGTGIGLSLCKRIVERHRGSIKAESELDEGATFVVTLPA
ncbi:MAG: CHASE3 domain-containing protein [Candidatus Obscuribacter sp.]|nr:CHASE3 domain-containing protein [Candidatus Obscuribacter sp.]